MHEFKFIQKYFSSLSKGFPGALNLSDDVYINYKKKIAISVDTFVEGIHFPNNSAPSKFLNKILAASFSDLYCKGINPTNYFLSIAAPSRKINKNWSRIFKKTLKKLQNKFNVYISGGDTTVSSKLVFTIMTIGSFKRKPILRNNAKLNDDIYVSGNLGDSYIGLQILNKKSNYKNLNNFFIHKYFNPVIQINFSKHLSKFASSSIDVSDGIYQDLKHICLQSKLGAILYLNKIPLSKNTQILINKKKLNLLNIFSQGDDYQILFTSSKKNRKKIVNIAKKTRTKITLIGAITDSKKIELVRKNTKLNIGIKNRGFIHQFC